MESPHWHPIQEENRETQIYGPQCWKEIDHLRNALAKEVKPHHQLEKEHSSATRTPSYDRNCLLASTIPCMMVRH